MIEVALLAGGMFSAQLVPQIAALLAKHQSHQGRYRRLHCCFRARIVYWTARGAGRNQGAGGDSEEAHRAGVAAGGGGNRQSRPGKVAAVLDAGRGDVYFGEYEIAGESVQVLQEQLLSKAEFLSAARESTVITPDPAWAAVARQAGLTVFTVEAPSAEMIARLGWRKLQAGETVSPEQLEANYMRRSDAEMFVKPSS